MTAIYKRELSSYFHSMIGWLFCAVLVFFTSIFFMVINLINGNPYFCQSLGNSVLIFMLLIPLLSMRSLSEERRTKTDQLLLTAPVTVGQIVLGKFFAMLTVIAIPTAIFCACPLIISANGDAYFAADYSSLLAFLLLGAVFASIGLFISSLTESQVIAAVATFGALFLVYLWDAIIAYIPTTALASFIGLIIAAVVVALILQAITTNWVLSCGVGAVLVIGLIALYVWKATLFANLLPQALAAFSITSAFSSFTGYFTFDLKAIILFLSITAFMLFLTAQMMQRRRWN